MFKLATVNVNFHSAQPISMWSAFVAEDPEMVLEGAVVVARYGFN